MALGVPHAVGYEEFDKGELVVKGFEKGEAVGKEEVGLAQLLECFGKIEDLFEAGDNEVYVLLLDDGLDLG